MPSVSLTLDGSPTGVTTSKNNITLAKDADAGLEYAMGSDCISDAKPFIIEADIGCIPLGEIISVDEEPAGIVMSINPSPIVGIFFPNF